MVGNTNSRKTVLSMTLVYACVFFLMLFLTWKTPYLSDDFHFNFYWTSIGPTGDLRLSENIGDVIGSTRNYYNLSGGRFLIHFFVFLLATTDKLVFDILNAFVFTLFGFLLYKYAFRDESFSAYRQVMIYLSAFLLPCFGDNVLWLSGSVNYLWAGTLLLGAISYTERHMEDNGWKSLLISSVLLFLSSLTNETTGGMLLVWLAVTLVAKIVIKNPGKSICLKMILFMGLCLAGLVVVISAPGNYARAGEMSVFFSDKTLDLIGQYVSWLYYNYGILIILVAAGLVVLILNRAQGCVPGIALTASALAGVMALTMVGMFYSRPAFLAIVVLYMAAWRLLHELLKLNDNAVMAYRCPLRRNVILISCIVGICSGVNIYLTNKWQNIISLAFLAALGGAAAFCGSCFIAGRVPEKLVSENIAQGTLKPLHKSKNTGMIKGMAMICALAFLTSSVFAYCSDIDRYNVWSRERYETYKADEPVSHDFNYYSILFPRESTPSEYHYDWIRAGEELNYDKPQFRMFY